MLLRENYLSKIRGFYNSDLIKILVVIRRCGKSVILNQIIKELKEKNKIDDKHKIFINFEFIEYEDLIDYKKLNKYYATDLGIAQIKNNNFEILDLISKEGSEIETLFVERINQLLKPNSIGAVVLPSSILNKDGNSFIRSAPNLYAFVISEGVVQPGIEMSPAAFVAVMTSSSIVGETIISAPAFLASSNCSIVITVPAPTCILSPRDSLTIFILFAVDANVFGSAWLNGTSIKRIPPSYNAVATFTISSSDIPRQTTIIFFSENSFTKLFISLFLLLLLIIF